jgi:hypothetical protein
MLVGLWIFFQIFLEVCCLCNQVWWHVMVYLLIWNELVTVSFGAYILSYEVVDVFPFFYRCLLFVNHVVIFN